MYDLIYQWHLNISSISSISSISNISNAVISVISVRNSIQPLSDNRECRCSIIYDRYSDIQSSVINLNLYNELLSFLVIPTEKPSTYNMHTASYIKLITMSLIFLIYQVNENISKYQWYLLIFENHWYLFT